MRRPSVRLDLTAPPSAPPAPARARLAAALVPLIAAAALVVAGCGSAGEGSNGPAAQRVAVVATTTVFADLVAQVGGPRVDVASLVPKGGVVETFDPTPSDVRRLAEADLVVTNGLGLDGWVAGLVRDSGTAAPVIELAPDLPGVDYIVDEEGSGEPNPHLWLNAGYARKYVARIADALAGVDPGRAQEYAQAAAAYDARLAALDEEVRAAVASVPAERRRVVSFHEAFPYFAAAYGLEVVDTIVSVPGQDPSAGEVAALVAEIRARRVTAIFSEIQFNDELVRTLAEETGVAVVSDLYNDTLGDPPVDTYERMIRWNTERVVAALRG